MSTADDRKTPEEIRAEIDATRGDLGYNVDALADKVNPSQIAHRQADRVKSRFSSAKESVMGTVHDRQASAGSSVGSGLDSAKGAGHEAVSKAKGNPLAVGLIAFGAGWLVSSLIPSSDAEQELAGQVKDAAAPLVDEAKSVAQEVGQNLKGPAQDAVASVKETAQDAVGSVQEEARSSASDVKDSAQSSTENVRNS